MRNDDWKIFKACVDTAIFPSARSGPDSQEMHFVFFLFSSSPTHLPPLPEAVFGLENPCACFSTFNLPVCRRSTTGDIGEWKNIRALAHTVVCSLMKISDQIFVYLTMTRSFYDGIEEK